MTMTAMASDYAYQDSKLGGRDRRKVGCNTYLERDGDTIRLLYHATYVLTWYPNGAVEYNDGGWRTVTTKLRFNDHGPLHIWSERGVWKFAGQGVEGIYETGMIFNTQTGEIIGAAEPEAVDERKKERKAINAFAKAYMDALEAGDVPKPGLGDCMFCGVFHEAATNWPDDPEHHIRHHIEEQYYVPSLLANAMRAVPTSQVEKWWVGSFWDDEATEEQRQQCRRFAMRKPVEKALRNYILRQLGH